MTEFKAVTPDFAVAAQILPADMARAAAAGFKLVISNRPTGESPDQPAEAELRTAAAAAGLEYRQIAFQGKPNPAVIAETALALADATGPVLGYCRTGMRSLMAWAMAQALSGARRPDELLALAGNAGYDLSGLAPVLATLAPQG
jgi:uncharacterized protein (TIGR01244 family)